MFVVVDHESNTMSIDLFKAMNFAINIPSSLSHASIVVLIKQTEIKQQHSIHLKQLFKDLFGQAQEIVNFQH